MPPAPARVPDGSPLGSAASLRMQDGQRCVPDVLAHMPEAPLWHTRVSLWPTVASLRVPVASLHAPDGWLQYTAVSLRLPDVSLRSADGVGEAKRYVSGP